MDNHAPMISVRHVWKVFGSNPTQIIGSPDANLSRSELRAKTGNTIAVRDVSSTLGAVYPAPSKNADDTTMALRTCVRGPHG